MSIPMAILHEVIHGIRDSHVHHIGLIESNWWTSPNLTLPFCVKCCHASSSIAPS